VVQQQAEPAAKDILGRLERAINDRDLEAIVDYFQMDVVHEYPAHAARSFRGRDQIWRNWAPVLARLADFKATLVRSATSDDIAWAEWLWQGTQADGSPGDMAGVIIHGLAGGKIAWTRVYMEPVDK
jgi:ketosteroid isomerase-like protein